MVLILEVISDSTENRLLCHFNHFNEFCFCGFGQAKSKSTSILFEESGSSLFL